MSYNQPKLSSCAQWDPNGITFANLSVIGGPPSNLFVDRNNTVYVADLGNSRVYTWRLDDTNMTIITLDGSFNPMSLFVTIVGDIYIGSMHTVKVEKWALNVKKGIFVMNAKAGSSCLGLFVDIANYLYCSLSDEHRVVKQSLNVSTNMTTTVAGNSSRGSASNTLYNPWGIFVNIKFELYVADCENNRVQLFKAEQLDGITVAGNNGRLSIDLNCPSAIFVDADGYLFIVDQRNNRIVGSSLNGIFCLAGCSGTHGPAFNQLDVPFNAAFDNYGNIFVADSNNNRIQKFILMKNACGKLAQS